MKLIKSANSKESEMKQFGSMFTVLLLLLSVLCTSWPLVYLRA